MRPQSKKNEERYFDTGISQIIYAAKMAVKRHPESADLQERLLELTEGMKSRRKQKEDGVLSTDEILEWLSAFDNTLNES